MSNRYGLEIRAATSADAPGLAELLSACCVATVQRDLEERFEAMAHERGPALIALEWGSPSGLVVVHWHRTLLATTPVAEITTLLIGPDQRRRGVGRLLLKAAARSARLAGCEILRLCFDGDRADLRAFGAANGFVEVATCLSRRLRKRGAHADRV